MTNGNGLDDGKFQFFDRDEKLKQGKEVHTVVWPPFDCPDRTVTSVGIKVDQLR